MYPGMEFMQQQFSPEGQLMQPGPMNPPMQDDHEYDPEVENIDDILKGYAQQDDLP